MAGVPPAHSLAVALAVLAVSGCAGADSGAAPPAAEATATASPTTTTPVDPTTTDSPTTTTATTTTTTSFPATTTTAAEVRRPPAEVVPFRRAGELAESLALAETALADPATDRRDFVGWARLQQQAYRDLVAHPGWQHRARDEIPGALRPAYDLNLHAVTELRLLTTPQTGLPDWRIVAPPPVEELRAHYDAAETEFGLPWTVLAAIHLVETRFGRVLGDSTAGAQGPMQFLPATWEAYGEGDIDDPGDAIRAAARYLVAHGAPDDLPRALYAYNHSDRYVAAVLAHAEAMERFDHYLAVYHQWRVYYRTVDGDELLEEEDPP